MRNILTWLAIPIVLVLVAIGIFVYRGENAKHSPALTPTLTPTPTPAVKNETAYCSPVDLEAIIETQGAAGSIYGTLKITNVSKKPCKILGGQYVGANYDKSVKNLSLSYLGDLLQQNFILDPNKSLYSQVRYPNGPQCSGPTKQTPVKFTYKVSPDDQVVFSNAGNLSQIVQTCSSEDQDTEITIWNISKTPITL